MRAVGFAAFSSFLAVAGSAAADSPKQHVVTLYRSSPIDSTMRIHLATFDAEETLPTYNLENCLIAAQLFQNQPSISVRYWCEPGRFKRDWK